MGAAISATSLSAIRQGQHGQNDTRKSYADFLQRAAACDGLSKALGQSIEFVVHNFSIRFGFVAFLLLHLDLATRGTMADAGLVVGTAAVKPAGVTTGARISALVTVV